VLAASLGSACGAFADGKTRSIDTEILLLMKSRLFDSVGIIQWETERTTGDKIQ
jgi:hypothetical protein